MAAAKKAEKKQKEFDPAEDVTGWAVDANPENDPTYPMKRHTKIEHDGYSWDRPPQQEPEVEVLHSTERPNLAATFGETVPPAGLSGAIRRAAFTYSENSYGHWVPLMLADRVQMVEGMFADLFTGRIPNLWRELGYSAEWKYNRKGLVTKLGGVLVVAAGIVAGSVVLISRFRSR